MSAKQLSATVHRNVGNQSTVCAKHFHWRPSPSGSLELFFARSSSSLRPCRGIDEIRVILELRIAQFSGCAMSDVSLTSHSGTKHAGTICMSFILTYHDVLMLSVRRVPIHSSPLPPSAATTAVSTSPKHSLPLLGGFSDLTSRL